MQASQQRELPDNSVYWCVYTEQFELHRGVTGGQTPRAALVLIESLHWMSRQARLQKSGNGVVPWGMTDMFRVPEVGLKGSSSLFRPPVAFGPIRILQTKPIKKL